MRKNKARRAIKAAIHWATRFEAVMELEENGKRYLFIDTLEVLQSASQLPMLAVNKFYVHVIPWVKVL